MPTLDELRLRHRRAFLAWTADPTPEREAEAREAYRELSEAWRRAGR